MGWSVVSLRFRFFLGSTLFAACCVGLGVGDGEGVFWSLSFRLIPWVSILSYFILGDVEWLGRLSLQGVEIDVVIPCRMYIFP